MRAFLIVSTLLTCGAAVSLAHADDKQVCNDAYGKAQTLRDEHKLVEAREQLRICGGPTCPGFIVKDCSDWLKDSEARTPSVVLEAKNAAGADVTDVKVTMDGAVLANKLEGLSIDVDPGAHTFVFESADGRAEVKALVKEGGKAQRVGVTLGAGGGAGGGAALVTTSPGTLTATGTTTTPSKSFLSEPVENGLSFGFRLGYGIPIGSVDSISGDSLSDIVSGQVPLWFDAGYLFNPYFYLGAYFSYGIASVPSTAGDGACARVSCSGSDIRVGLDVQFRILGTAKLQPWVGLGALGYENGSVNASSALGSESVSVSGVEWVNPQVGFDYKFLPVLSAGAFLGLSISEFFGESVSPEPTMPVSLGNKTLHEWLYIGARTTFDLHI